jgi:hypothetical protein
MLGFPRSISIDRYASYFDAFIVIIPRFKYIVLSQNKNYSQEANLNRS